MTASFALTIGLNISLLCIFCVKTELSIMRCKNTKLKANAGETKDARKQRAFSLVLSDGLCSKMCHIFGQLGFKSPASRNYDCL